MTNPREDKRLKMGAGLTLIELVIATGILSMVLVMALGSYNSFIRVSNQTQHQREASEIIQSLYSTIASQLWQTQQIKSITNTKVELILRDNNASIIPLEFSNNKITLNGKKLLPDNVKLYKYNGKVFEGISDSPTATQQQYLKTSFVMKIYDKRGRLIKEYPQPISFIHTLRI